MSDVPNDLKYAASHEWVRDDGDGKVTIGISDHAQQALGDLVFVELPEVGAEFGANDAASVVESVKAASDVYAPVGGVVVATNDKLEDAPELVNEDPYGEGWLFKLESVSEVEMDELLSGDDYAAQIADE